MRVFNRLNLGVFFVVNCILVVFISGCASKEPFRYEIAESEAAKCNILNRRGDVLEHCHTLIKESSDSYDLLFAEIDDQGWINNNRAANTTSSVLGSDQNELKDQFYFLKNYFEENKNTPLLIFTYVHGWKNNASGKNDNVALFRQQLKYLAEAHKRLGTKKKIVGVYIGWRGDSLLGPDPWRSLLTFYDRKAAAEKVSNGALHEFVAYISSYASSANETVPGCLSDGTKPRANCPVNTIYVGHSFGGLILFESLKGKMFDAIVSDHVNGQQARVDRRFADLVVLINPAVEATKFQPLFRSVRRSHYEKSVIKNRIISADNAIGSNTSLIRPEGTPKWPLMILITTKADQPVGTWFRLGRSFNSIFQTTTSKEQEKAYIHSIGFMEEYVTHDLKNYPLEKVDCYNEGNRWPKCVGPGNVLSIRNESYKDLQVWNINTDDSVMGNHSDINRAELFEFVADVFNKIYSFRPITDGVKESSPLVKK